jgi:hypothetical protein
VNVLENSISHNNRIETYWVKMVTAASMFQNMTRTFGDILLYRPAACMPLIPTPKKSPQIRIVERTRRAAGNSPAPPPGVGSCWASFGRDEEGVREERPGEGGRRHRRISDKGERRPPAHQIPHRPGGDRDLTGIQVRWRLARARSGRPDQIDLELPQSASNANRTGRSWSWRSGGDPVLVDRLQGSGARPGDEQHNSEGRSSGGRSSQRRSRSEPAASRSSLLLRSAACQTHGANDVLHPLMMDQSNLDRQFLCCSVEC